MSEKELFDARLLDGDILAVVLRGDLDSTSAPEFTKQIQAHLDSGRSKIIIDCRNMGYISSLGIGSLVTLQSRLRRQGGEVKLAAILGPAMELLRLMRMDKILSIHGDLEFARKSFYAPGQAPPS
jgi:anti-anti-sigma factor